MEWKSAWSLSDWVLWSRHQSSREFPMENFVCLGFGVFRLSTDKKIIKVFISLLKQIAPGHCHGCLNIVILLWRADNFTSLSLRKEERLGEFRTFIVLGFHSSQVAELAFEPKRTYQYLFLIANRQSMMVLSSKYIRKWPGSGVGPTACPALQATVPSYQGTPTPCHWPTGSPPVLCSAHFRPVIPLSRAQSQWGVPHPTPLDQLVSWCPFLVSFTPVHSA